MIEPQVESFYRNLRLDEFQQEAIAAVAAHKSVLVSAPTGSGKTLIADFAVERILKQGQRCVYTAPIKALSNQKYRDYCAMLGQDQVGIMTGDVVININAPLVIMTTEVLLNLLHREMSRVEGVGCVIFDELHYLANAERGTVWEETLVLLPPDLPIVGLSATIDNIAEISEWLASIKKTEVVAIIHKERPVPLKILAYSRETGLDTPEHLERWREKEIEHYKRSPEYRQALAETERSQGRGRGGRGRRGSRSRSRSNLFRNLFLETRHVDVLDEVEREGMLPCLYFAFSRRKCEVMAQELRKDLLTADERRRVQEHLDQKMGEFGHYAAAERLRKLLLTGVGYHHAGLFPFLKEVVETLYEQRLIKVLYCTSTFALGVNMPAKTACFDGVVKFDGQISRLLHPLEFFQKAGRAGRRGMDKVGFVVIRRDMRSAENIPDYRESDIQPINSALNLSYNSVVNLLETYDLERIERLLRDSFWQYQKRREIQGYRHEVEHLLGELKAIDGVEIVREPEMVARRAEELTRELAAAERKKGQRPRRSSEVEDLESEDLDSDGMRESLGQKLRAVKTLGLFVRRRGTQGKKRAPKLQKRIEQLAEKIHFLESFLMETFKERCRILERLGYLTPDYRFNNGANIVKHLHIQELLVAELILDGVLDDLDVYHLSALLCCIGQSDKRRGEGRPPVLPLDRTLIRRIRNILRKIRDAGAEQVEPIELNFDYAIVGLMWCQGADFSELLSISNLDEGDIISCFRQTIDLLKQLKDVYQADQKMIQHLNVCIDIMDRDVVRVVL